MLTDTQKDRYSRHLMLSEVGSEGQERLLKSSVLVIGAGGLGSPVALYLAAAGVGTIGIVDFDKVELSNLQRQIIHHTPDLGRPKVQSAREKLSAINPDIRVEIYQTRVTAANIRDIFAPYDFVIDATDNFAAKFLINDACVMAQKPFSHGGILKFDGQTLTVKPGQSACYRCIFPEPPEGELAVTCARAGVLGVLPGVIGSLQATETLKFLLGQGNLLTDRLLTYDALRMRFHEVPVRRNPVCPVCGTTPTITTLDDGIAGLGA